MVLFDTQVEAVGIQVGVLESQIDSLQLVGLVVALNPQKGLLQLTELVDTSVGTSADIHMGYSHKPMARVHMGTWGCLVGLVG